jgi:hypothetical protein
MFHAISAWLARQQRRVLNYGVARDTAYAAANGWHGWQTGPSTWSYADPRFIDRAVVLAKLDTGCSDCDSKVAEWYREGLWDRRFS